MVMAELGLLGGAPVRPQGYPEWPVHDEGDAEAVAEVVRSGRWGGFPEPGPLAADFAERFAAYQGAGHGVVMANGTVTMEVALKALGIGWGDEVIVPALTFAATPYAAMAAGALLLRRVRLLQPPVDQAADRRRGGQPAHRRRAAGPAGPLADRLRPGQGPRREGVHLRGQLPPGRAAGGPAPAGPGAAAGPAGPAGRGGRVVPGAGRPGPGGGAAPPG